MGRRLTTYRSDLGLLLAALGCHSGQRLDWADFEVAGAAREMRDAGAVEAPKMDAGAADLTGVPNTSREPRHQLGDSSHPAVPGGASNADEARRNGGSDAGESTAPDPWGAGTADDADAGDAPDRDNDAAAGHAGEGGDDAGPTSSSTQVCPAPGGGPQEVRLLPDGNSGDCWVGPTWELGKTFARGTLTTTDSVVVVGAYLFSGAASAKTQVYDADGNPLAGCVVIDDEPDRQWRETTFDGATCQGAAFARVTAHSTPDGDL